MRGYAIPTLLFVASHIVIIGIALQMYGAM